MKQVLENVRGYHKKSRYRVSMVVTFQARPFHLGLWSASQQIREDWGRRLLLRLYIKRLPCVYLSILNLWLLDYAERGC
jgi:hypothetical protein